MQNKGIFIGLAALLLLIGVGSYLLFFKGSCEGNCRNGFGSMTYWNGQKYVGQWKNGTQDGFGILVDKDRKILFSGRWIEGEQGSKENIKKTGSK